VKILVTGAEGYIGRMLVPALKEVGHTVSAIDNYRNEKERGLSEYVDVKHDTILPYYVNKDIIIPLAALVGAPLCMNNAREAAEVNLVSIQKMLANTDAEIIYPTTNSGYGSGIVDEESPLNPVSMYGQTKVRAEAAILERGNAITLRLATVFGVSPCMRDELLVNWLVLEAFKGNTVELFESHYTRNYVHIRDVVHAFMYCIENFKDMKDNCYNYGLSNANLSKRELCQLIGTKYTENGAHKDIDQRNYIVSNQKAEDKGLKATISLHTGIKELIVYYMQRNIGVREAGVPIIQAG